MGDDTRDRLIALEVEVKHLTENLAETHKLVTELHSLLLQAKGARWVIIAAASIAGALASFALKATPWFAAGPR